jgi:sterol-4alpha-carboxylate 3-dehydrogenase (decarboxylating)
MKNLAVDLVLPVNRKHDILTVALRPTGVFGEGDINTCGNLVKACHRGKTRFQMKNNTNSFEFTRVQNVAHADMLAMQKLMDLSELFVQSSTEARVDCEVFFITNDQPRLFWNLVREVWVAADDNGFKNRLGDIKERGIAARYADGMNILDSFLRT